MSEMVPMYGFGGGGGKGAALTVNAPAGATVTVSKDGKTKTKAANSDGVAVFKGLSTGEWTLTITNGTDTAQKTVAITADYSAAITFFAATISVTYPAGSVCTATDGVTTLTAPDTSGAWTCVVPNAGTWTVALTDKGWTYPVVITEDGQSETVDLSKFYLYHAGNDFAARTGGWESKRTCDLTENADNLYAVSNAANSANTGVFATVRKIDLTEFSALNYSVKSGPVDNYCGLIILASIPAVGTDPRTNAAAKVAFTKNLTVESSLDISGLTGEYYVGGYVMSGASGTGSINLYQMSLA